MSVLIKGIVMPSECEYCPLCRYYSESKNVWCNALEVILKRQWNYVLDPHLNVPRREDCPLVEVPTPHGRLIDADVLEREMTNGIKAGNLEEGYEDFANINNVDDCVDCVRYADTIIEAED